MLHGFVLLENQGLPEEVSKLKKKNSQGKHFSGIEV